MIIIYYLVFFSIEPRTFYKFYLKYRHQWKTSFCPQISMLHLHAAIHRCVSLIILFPRRLFVITETSLCLFLNFRRCTLFLLPTKSQRFSFPSTSSQAQQRCAGRENVIMPFRRHCLKCPSFLLYSPLLSNFSARRYAVQTLRETQINIHTTARPMASCQSVRRLLY